MDANHFTVSRHAAYDVNFLAALFTKFRAFDELGKIILFGSRAKEENRYYSDYDLLFISNKFAGMSIEARYKLIIHQIRQPHSEWTIEPHTYTVHEWQALAGTLFHDEVTKYAKDVAELIQGRVMTRP